MRKRLGPLGLPARPFGWLRDQVERSTSFFFVLFPTQNLLQFPIGQKSTSVINFCDFGLFPRVFLVKIHGFGVPFWIKIRGKSENRDFVKIVLPPRREHDFEGSDPPKIELECDFERRWSKKSMKTASGAILGSSFFALCRFFVDLGVQLGSQTGLFGPTFGRLS